MTNDTAENEAIVQAVYAVLARDRKNMRGDWDGHHVVSDNTGPGEYLWAVMDGNGNIQIAAGSFDELVEARERVLVDA